MPDGTELANRLAMKFLGKQFVGRPLAQTAELAIAETSLREVQEYIADQFRLFDPAPFHCQISELPWKAIATTNYDLIIERAYENPRAIQELVPFIRDGQRIEERLTSRKSIQYIKLHGCITLITDPALPLILTPDQYITHRQGRRRLYERLRDLAGDYPLIFAGHSLADPDIRAILLELDQPEADKPRSYVVVPSITEVEKRLWQQRRFTVIQSTFEKFIGSLLGAVPAGTYALVPEVMEDHPISKHLRTSAPIPEQLKTFLEDRCELVHQNLRAAAPSPANFYAGYIEGWSPIINNLDISRALLERMLEELVIPEESEREATQELVLITGHAGAGKSVLLRRLAWEAAVQFSCVCVYMSRGLETDSDHIQELHRVTGKRIFLFFDRALVNREIIVRILRDARREKIPVSIVASARTHALKDSSAETLMSEVTADYELRYLNEDEIESLLDKLEQFNALGRLKNLSQRERLKAFQEQAGRQLLVALHEATLGKPFAEIIADEYRSISSPTAQALYRTIAIVHRLGVPVRAGLLSRVHNVSFTTFRERFFAPLSNIVFCRKDPSFHDHVYETRHPVIADLVFEQILTDERDRHDEYVRILSALDIDFASDRDAMRGLTRARDLQKLFANKSMALEIVSTAQNRSPDDPRLLQQEAIVHMNWPDSELAKAQALLERAAAIAEHDSPIKHSLAELMLKRSEAASNPIERRHLRNKVRSTCAEIIRRSRRSSYAFHTLLKLSLQEIDELASNDPGSLPEKVKDIEQLLERAKNAFPEDAHILEAESRLADFLDQSSQAVEALKSAFRADPRSTYIALRLAAILQKRQLIDQAIEVLKQCLEANPLDGAVHFRLGRLLMLPHNVVDSVIVYHLRKSFVRGDTNWVRQFWYARASYLLDDEQEATSVFRDLERADIPPREHRTPTAVCKDSAGRLIRFAGTVERMYARYGFAARDSTASPVFLHADHCQPDVWSKLRIGQRIAFSLAFNYRGPVAIDMTREN